MILLGIILIIIGLVALVPVLVTIGLVVALIGVAPMRTATYVDVILQRFADLTGKEPQREDGLIWSDLKASS